MQRNGFALNIEIKPTPGTALATGRACGEAVRRFGRVPSLVEWDDRIPPLDEVVEERRRAAAIEAEVLSPEPTRLAS